MTDCADAAGDTVNYTELVLLLHYYFIFYYTVVFT